MNKRERIEQRRIVVKAIRRELRNYAAAKRKDRADASPSVSHERKTSLGCVLGMKSLAYELGILRPSYEDDLSKRIERRVDRVIEAHPTRRPFALKAAA